MNEAQDIHNDLYRGCGLDKGEMPELSGASDHLSIDDEFHNCVAMNEYFTRFHTWHEETFSKNTLKCDLEAIEDRKKKHRRWEKIIRRQANCDDDAMHTVMMTPDTLETNKIPKSDNLEQ